MDSKINSARIIHGGFMSDFAPAFTNKGLEKYIQELNREEKEDFIHNFMEYWNAGKVMKFNDTYYIRYAQIRQDTFIWGHIFNLINEFNDSSQTIIQGQELIELIEKISPEQSMKIASSKIWFEYAYIDSGDNKQFLFMPDRRVFTELEKICLKNNGLVTNGQMEELRDADWSINFDLVIEDMIFDGILRIDGDNYVLDVKMNQFELYALKIDNTLDYYVESEYDQSSMPRDNDMRQLIDRDMDNILKMKIREYYCFGKLIYIFPIKNANKIKESRFWPEIFHYTKKRRENEEKYRFSVLQHQDLGPYIYAGLSDFPNRICYGNTTSDTSFMSNLYKQNLIDQIMILMNKAHQIIRTAHLRSSPVRSFRPEHFIWKVEADYTLDDENWITKNREFSTEFLISANLDI